MKKRPVAVVRGCLEQYSSATGIVRLAKALASSKSQNSVAWILYQPEMYLTWLKREMT